MFPQAPESKAHVHSWPGTSLGSCAQTVHDLPITIKKQVSRVCIASPKQRYEGWKPLRDQL